MALSDRARDWWNRRQDQQQARRDQADMDRIPVLDIRNSEEVAPPRWPEADILDQEREAVLANGVPDISLDFQTRTINPPRPRTVGAGYDPATQTLRIKFRPGASASSPGGAVYDYHDVTQKEWWAIQHAISTGRFINNQLTTKDYTRIY